MWNRFMPNVLLKVCSPKASLLDCDKKTGVENERACFAREVTLQWPCHCQPNQAWLPIIL